MPSKDMQKNLLIVMGCLSGMHRYLIHFKYIIHIGDYINHREYLETIRKGLLSNQYLISLKVK
jgi:hypothetical protein